jgi:hypothetical protein
VAEANIGADRDVATQTIGKVQDFDALKNVFVCMAHDEVSQDPIWLNNSDICSFDG